MLFHSFIVIGELSPSSRIDGLFVMAGLPDPGGISPHLGWNWCLPLLNRWSTADNIRVHHGQSVSEGHSDNDLSSGLLPIGHCDSGNDSGDVQLRIVVYDSDDCRIYAG